MMRALRSALCLSALVLPSACGTSAELTRDDHARDDRALSSRADHDEVVRLAGDVDGPAAEGGDCPEACARDGRVRELTDRICETAGRDDHDDATQFLCEDARERAASTQRRAAACTCS